MFEQFFANPIGFSAAGGGLRLTRSDAWFSSEERHPPRRSTRRMGMILTMADQMPLVHVVNVQIHNVETG